VTLDADAVTAAVDEIARMLRADGADLAIVEIDPAASRVRLELRFDEVRCAECVLAPDDLAATVEGAIGRRVPGEFELVLADPRR
jgi:hypothetical protein